MRVYAIPATIAISLLIGCSEETTGVGSDSDLLLESSEESAVVVAESVGLDSGGLLEAIEATLLDVEDPAPPLFEGNPKAGLTDEAVFDSASCTWTLDWFRQREGIHAGFSWSQTRTLHFMDAEGGCIVEPDGEGNVKAIDFTREYSGESWNPRKEGSRTGWGDWEIRELHDDAPGARVNGQHFAEGLATINRRGEDGQIFQVEHSYTLEVEGTDLLVLARPNGRRIPVEGTLHIVYDAIRGDRVIHREVTITFGEGEGVIDFGQELRYRMNTISGELID